MQEDQRIVRKMMGMQQPTWSYRRKMSLLSHRKELKLKLIGQHLGECLAIITFLFVCTTLFYQRYGSSKLLVASFSLLLTKVTQFTALSSDIQNKEWRSKK